MRSSRGQGAGPVQTGVCRRLVMMAGNLADRHALAVGGLAMEVAGGVAFFRMKGLEHRFWDLQGAQYHPMQAGPQAEYTACIALEFGGGEGVLRGCASAHHMPTS